MKIKDKWKVFAIGHFFSCEPSPRESVRLFDELMKCETEEDLRKFLRENDDAILWEPFEYPDRHFPRTVEALTWRAQEVEGGSDALDGIDWALLREQRAYLDNEADNNSDASEIYAGVSNLLYHLQDYAAGYLGDVAVFGYTVEEEA